MAGTTSNYGFDYPTSTDLVRNGASAIQTLANDIDTFIAASGVGTSGKLFNVYSTDVTTSTTTTATTPTNIPTNPNSTTFTTGKTGLFLVWVSARLTAPSSTTFAFVSPQISGAVTSTADTLRSGTTYGNNAVTTTWMAAFEGTANTSTTIDLRVWASGAGTTTITRSHCIVVALG